MKLLTIKYSGQVNHLGTRRYVIFEDEEKVIATIFTNTEDIKEVAEEYLKAKKEWDVIIDYDTEDNIRKY